MLSQEGWFTPLHAESVKDNSRGHRPRNEPFGRFLTLKGSKITFDPFRVEHCWPLSSVGVAHGY